jgi:hypothetical protein
VGPVPVPLPPVFFPGTPENKAFVDTTTKVLDSIYNMAKGNRPPGFWPGDKGAIEWGKRNGVDPREAKDRFHKGIKPRCHTPGARDDLSTNPVILKLGMLLMETAIMQGIWAMTTTNRRASALCLQLM